MVEFGIQLEPHFGFTYQRIRDLARQAEEGGFASVWCSDHFFLHQDSVEQNAWDCWTALAGLAVETRTIRIGSLVTCVSYRHPPVLAKIAACVDVMSGGRLEFGIGAGWKEVEYRAYGIPFPPARERVDRLEEALEVVKRLWSQDRADYQGRYYQLQDALSAPKPAQKPHPPVWVGGSGDRVLDLAARYADAVNIVGFPPLERYADRLEALRRACQRRGRDFDAVKKTHFTLVMVAEDDASIEARWQAMGRTFNRDPQEVKARFSAFQGTPAEVAQQMGRFRDLGVEGFVCLFPFGFEEESMRLVMEQVAPRV